MSTSATNFNKRPHQGFSSATRGGWNASTNPSKTHSNHFLQTQGTSLGQKVNNLIDNNDFTNLTKRKGFAGLTYVGQTKRGSNKKETPSDFGIYAHTTQPRERLQSAHPTSKPSQVQRRIEENLTVGIQQTRNDGVKNINTMTGTSSQDNVAFKNASATGTLYGVVSNN